MKGSLSLLGVLALLSLGLLAGAQAVIGAGEEDVRIQETVLMGDPAAARGIQVSAHYEYDWRLHWLSRFPAGHAEALETEFTWSAVRGNINYIHRGGRLSVNLVPQGRIYLQAGDELEESLREYSATALLPLVRRAIDEALDHGITAEADGDYEASLPLEECCDYLPISFGTWEIPFLTPDEESMLADYFRIPIPPDTRAKVLVSWLDPEVWYSVSITLEDYTVDVSCDTVFLDGNGNDLLFAIGLGATDLPMDGSLIPGGWGIYRLTCAINERGELLPPSLTTVYSPPARERILRFWASGDKSQLFLLTRRPDDMLCLTVLDGETVAPRQTLELFPCALGALLEVQEDGEYWYADTLMLKEPYQGEDFMAILSGYSLFLPESTVHRPEESRLLPQLALLVQQPDGSWQVRFTDELWTLQEQGLALVRDSSLQMDFDGRRLALIFQSSPGAVLAVWDGTELACMLSYSHSLTDTYSAADNVNGCYPVYNQPWTVAFSPVSVWPDSEPKADMSSVTPRPGEMGK